MTRDVGSLTDWFRYVACRCAEGCWTVASADPEILPHLEEAAEIARDRAVDEIEGAMNQCGAFLTEDGIRIIETAFDERLLALMAMPLADQGGRA